MHPVTKKKIVAEASDYKREKHANEESRERGEKGKERGEEREGIMGSFATQKVYGWLFL